MKKIQYLVLSILLLAVSCMRDNGDAFTFVEFGVSETVIQFPAAEVWAEEIQLDSLTRYLEIYTNSDVNITFPDGEASWLHMKNTETGKAVTSLSVSADANIRFDCDENSGYARLAKLEAATADGTRTETVYIKQTGAVTPELNIGATTLLLNGSASGTGVVDFETNIADLGTLESDVTYSSETDGEWISSVEVKADAISLSYSVNPSGTDLRFATLTVKFTDGTGEEFSDKLYIVQKTSSDDIGTTSSFEQIRGLALTPKRTVSIKNNFLVSAYVVSDLASGNVGENPKTSSTSTNYEAYKKNVFLESEDGTYGFVVHTATAEDNIFDRYDKVTLLLSGCTITFYEEPDRYVIDSLTVSNIIERVPGTKASIPVKEKTISELTDEDMYTYVTLTDCEFAIRKGCLTPVNEAFASGNGNSRLVKYPTLVRDAGGESIYVYTNTTCPYRRDGTPRYKGSGTISGVLVHELFPAYIYGDGDYSDEHGNIGRYQLRHMSADDIAFDESESFSTTLVEFSCVPSIRMDGSTYYFPATTGSGRFYHSTGAKVNYPLSTMNYIGWVGSAKGIEPFRNHLGCDMSLPEPLGYDFPVDEDWYEANVNTDGTGKVGRENSEPWDGWRSLSWWNDEGDFPYAWIVEFSTAGITADHLSMQFTAVGGVTGAVGKSPYYWKAQWSQTGDMNTDSDWTDIGDYVVPDGTVSSAYAEWQLPAMKQYDMPLPADILGKSRVYIRLIPKNKITNTLYFNEGTIEKGTDSGNTMDYFAVRYN